MSSALVETTEDERPDWCPEGVWPFFKRQMVLVHAKVDKSSMQQIANKWQLPVGKVLSFCRTRKFRLQMEESREDLTQSALAAAYKTGELLHAALDDPERVAKISPKDLSTIAKQQTDIALNLANGAVTASPLHFHFSAVKELLAQTVEKPVVGKVIDAART